MTDPTDLLHRFLQTHDDADLDARRSALRRAIETGGGSWMIPQTAPDHPRPGSHLTEISLYGVAATGFTEDEAAANWFTVANRVTERRAS